MSDLKIIERLTKPIRMLGDAEIGRLVRAMLDYQECGTDTDLRGNERFLWDDAKASIDRRMRTSKARSEAGKKGMSNRWNNNPITNDNNSITNDNNPITNGEKEKNQKKDIYIPTSDSVDSNLQTDVVTDAGNTSREHSNVPTIPSSIPATQKPKPSRYIIPPTVEMVRAYCEERNNGIDPQAFVDHYTSNGWMVGKTRMKDWQASVRTWEQQRGRYGAARKPEPKPEPQDKFANLRNLYEHFSSKEGK